MQRPVEGEATSGLECETMYARPVFMTSLRLCIALMYVAVLLAATSFHTKTSVRLIRNGIELNLCLRPRRTQQQAHTTWAEQASYANYTFDSNRWLAGVCRPVGARSLRVAFCFTSSAGEMQPPAHLLLIYSPSLLSGIGIQIVRLSPPVSVSQCAVPLPHPSNLRSTLN